MTIDSHLITIQNCISNRLDYLAIGDRRIAGVIGDAPSHYSKSPALWNAAFAHLAMVRPDTSIPSICPRSK